VFNTYVNALIKNPQYFSEPAPSIARRFQGHPELMYQFSPTLFTGDARQFVNFFWNTGIAYNFSLDMTEVNNLDTQVDFVRPLTRSTTTLGLKGGIDRQRENTRTFTITDDFKGLITLKPHDYCDQHLASGANVIYPIAGRIGIEPFIQEFVNIALFANLGIAEGGSAPTMVDTLQFQTVLSGSAIPKVVFSPVGRNFQLADASLTAEVSRTDVHTLTMGLSIVAATTSQAAPRSNALFGRLLTASGGGTKRAAADAVDQDLTRQILRRPVNITVNQ
jgi:hypothetical protein